MSVSLTHESFPVPQSATRSFAISRYDADKFVDDAWMLIQQFNTAPAAQQAWYVSGELLSLVSYDKLFCVFHNFHKIWSI